jgi:hypothetical protein
MCVAPLRDFRHVTDLQRRFSDTLISGVQRYDPASAAVLEEYLSAQIKDDTYDSMANLALLKLSVRVQPVSRLES